MKITKIPFAFIEINYDAIAEAQRLMDQAVHRTGGYSGEDREITPKVKKVKKSNKKGRNRRVRFSEREIEQMLRMIERKERLQTISNDPVLGRYHSYASVATLYYTLLHGGREGRVLPKYIKVILDGLKHEKGLVPPFEAPRLVSDTMINVSRPPQFRVA